MKRVKRALLSVACALGTLGASLSAECAEVVLSSAQEKVRAIAHKIGSSACVELHAKQVCFGETLQAIAYQESSFGDRRIGSGTETIYYYMERGRRVQVSEREAKTSKRHILKEVREKPLSERALGSFQIMPETAKRVISERGMSEWGHLLKNETKLVKELIKNDSLGARIASEYLKMNFEKWSAEKRGSPWKYTISKYNGGSDNHEYVQDIVQRMREIRTLSEGE